MEDGGSAGAGGRNHLVYFNDSLSSLVEILPEDPLRHNHRLIIAKLGCQSTIKLHRICGGS